MKKYILALLALLTPSVAHAQEDRFPGSAWFNITGPHVGGEEAGNWVMTGNATQNVVLAELNSWKLNTYVSVGFSKDTEGYEWNNKIIPGVGLGVTKDIGPGVMSIGVQAIHEEHFGKIYKTRDRSASGVQVAISYWIGWGR